MDFDISFTPEMLDIMKNEYPKLMANGQLVNEMRNFKKECVKSFLKT